VARILIADDEDLERAALRYIITGSGLESEFLIDEARNGNEALELGRTGTYDVLFLDVKMPGLDGLRAAEELRKAGVLSPIVIVSAFDTFEYAQKAIRIGVYEYLLKPAGSDEVISALKRSLEWNREPEALSRKRDESISAISGAARKLEDSLAAQMRGGSLGGAAIREYENLSSLTDSPRSVIAFRIQLNSGAGSLSVEKALVNGVLGAAEKALEHSRKIIKAESGDRGFILVYGPKSPSGVAAVLAEERAGGEGRVLSSGFQKNLRGDPLWPLVERMNLKLRDSAPCAMLCGLAGPSLEDTDTLFSRAFEGSRLASPECPAVRLASLPRSGEGEAIQIGPADPKSRSLGMRALDFIKGGYSRELTLVSAAEELGVNPFHLSHAISRELGIGFSELLRRVRVNRAKELMIGGGSIKEASYLVGFSDQAYFSRVFKKIEGQNPKRFIEQTAKKYKK